MPADIHSVTPSGAGLRLLAGGGQDSGPRWSPNGRELAYLDNGNLWIMNADGSHKHQVTSGAPGHADGRPTWSPSGRYLAFVLTARRARYGYLTRYDTVTRHFATFTTTIAPLGLISVPARPGTAVAWQRALNGASAPGYFILYEGAGAACQARHYCLDALGLGSESQVSNGYPSIEAATSAPVRLTDPDWYPILPRFAINVLTTVESCTLTGCAHVGIESRILGPLILPGAYEGVYSPLGSHLAFVRDQKRGPEVYVTVSDPKTAASRAVAVTAGSEPDWQPVAPFPPA